MNDEQMRRKVDAWVDGWMDRIKARAKEYRAQGIEPVDAEEAAIYDIRMEIRSAPPPDFME